jgi:hypothetical protein
MSTNQTEWPDGKKACTDYAVLYGTRRNAILYQTEAVLLKAGEHVRIRRGIEAVQAKIRSKADRLLGKQRDTGIRGGHNVMYNRFFRYLNGDIEIPVSWDEAIHVMETVEKIGIAMQREIDKFNSK